VKDKSFGVARGQDPGWFGDGPAQRGLAEELSRRSERLLLMTATPHSGDPARFQNFLKLLDPDQFAVADVAKAQIGRDDSPYFLRRQKEDLKDEHGAPLFVPREVRLQPFELSEPELALYEAVTDYIREFLGQVGGRKANAIALARTVFQRRLATNLPCWHSCSTFRRACWRELTTRKASANVYQAGYAQKSAIAPRASPHTRAR